MGLRPDVPPGSARGDHGAVARLRRILASVSYVPADHDTAFLHRDDLRHLRLQLEYLKAELALREHDVRSTIFVLGGTRIVEPAVARRNAERLRMKFERRPGDATLARNLHAAERILAKSRYYDVAREFGRIASEFCRRECPSEFVIVTGGGPGIMEAANRGAYEAGRATVGMNITLPTEQTPNSYITPELCLQFRYFALRKFHFITRAKALVVFPGGYGTLDELFDALCLLQTGKIDRIPVIMVGEEFWRTAFPAGFLADEGVISPKDTELFCFAETAEEIWGYISAWYARDLSPP